MDEGAQVRVGRLAVVCRELDVRSYAEQFQNRTDKSQVEFEECVVLPLVERLQGILVVEVEGTAVVGGLDSAPMGALPGCGVLDTNIRDQGFALMAYNWNGKCLHAIS